MDCRERYATHPRRNLRRTGLSLAGTCVVTSATHGYTSGDIVIVVSGWSRINGKAFRVDNETTDTFELEGLDTSNTTIYPPGAACHGLSLDRAQD